MWVELIKVPKGLETDIYKSVVKAVELGANAIRGRGALGRKRVLNPRVVTLKMREER